MARGKAKTKRKVQRIMVFENAQLRQERQEAREHPPEWQRELLRQIDGLVKKPGALAMFRKHARCVADTFAVARKDKDGYYERRDLLAPGPSLNLSEKFYLLAAFHDVFAKSEQMPLIIVDWPTSPHYTQYWSYASDFSALSDERLQPHVLQRHLEDVKEAVEEAEQKKCEANVMGKGDSGADKEIPWRDDAPEFITNSEAVRLPDDTLSLSTLSRLLTPDGPIRYMRKYSATGRPTRCKVHVQDFQNYIKASQGRVIPDGKLSEIMDDYLEKTGKEYSLFKTKKGEK